MEGYSENSRRIAKNTLMLYVRMFFMLIVGLYTSRVVLGALGEQDYGVYNVIGGVVAMFSIISGALSSAVSRFITFEMGKGEGAQLNKVYSTAVMIQLALSLIIVALAEPLGLWFIDNKMTIDPSRTDAAVMVLHFSILSFVINLMSVPQMASITAHEKMSAYAYIGILDGILRLAVALVIASSSSDRLVLYAILMTLAVLVVRMSYGFYCRKHFPECRFRLVLDSSLIKEMFSFAGWNFIGVTSGVLRDHGGNILINVFFGTAVNAARGIAVQLSGTVQNFVLNFMTAVNPQITKSYASGDREYMLSLVRKSSRMSYYLLLLLVLPVLFNTEYILEIWLKEVPDQTVCFVQLFLIMALSESLSNPLVTAAQATGRIRRYQLTVGGIIMLNLPVSYLFLRSGCGPEVTVIVAIVISQICLAVRLLLLRGMIGLSVRTFLRKVYFNVAGVTAVSFILSMLSESIVPEGLWGFVSSVFLCMISAVLAVLFAGCSRTERQELKGLLFRRLGL